MDFAVIGIGRFGSAVVRTLYEMGHHVLAIDRDEDALRSVQDSSTHSVQLDSTDPEALRADGITNFDDDGIKVRDPDGAEGLGITNFDAVVVSIGAGVQE